MGTSAAENSGPFERDLQELRAGGALADPADPAVAAMFREWSLSTPSPASVVICHGFGCAFRTEIAMTALQTKLATLGITPPILNTVEEELNREGYTLGPLGKPPPMLGSFDALRPQALAGRWLADKL